ncbi:MAG TPA: ABC transporter permease [Gemmatimonadaceae bacterium]|jgi:putative ABC transport system permease protein
MAALDAVRLSARTLRKQPVFTTVVILSLALAIALNTTMYSVLDAMTHPRLDLRKPEQLYRIAFFGDYKGRVDDRQRDAALASGMHSYSAIARESGGTADALLEHGLNVSEGAVQGVGENYFDVIGPRIIAGRTFVPSDAQLTNSPVVLGEETAAQLFPNGESPIGGTVDIEQVPHVVIGVVSAESDFPHLMTRGWEITAYPVTKGMYGRLIRLRDGATRQQAEQELSVIAARIVAVSGENLRDVAFRMSQAADPEYQARPFQYALELAVCAVLLVACANLANLQLARGIGRRRDLALRAALGATRARILRHLLTESALLAAAGLGVGLLFTYFGGHLLTASIPPSMGEYVVTPHMSWRVLLFALAATILCLVLIGLAPAVFVSKADPNELLKSGAGTGATKRNRRRYGILVCVEMALALALSSAAALSVRSALFVYQGGVGFDPTMLATGYAGTAIAQKGTVVHYADELQALANRVATVDGVTAAAASTTRPVFNNGISIEDAGGVREFPTPMYSLTIVSPSYLRTLGFPVIRGRDFYDGERDDGAVIIDEHTAQVLWPNANPIGAQIKFGDLHSALPYVRVVGILGEQPGFESEETEGLFASRARTLGRILYLPGPADTIAVGYSFPMSFIARTAKNPEKLPTALRRSFALRGDVYARSIASMSDALGITRARQSATFISELFALFAALGLALAAFGVYGVVAHSVAERRRELGVRIALGATARDILHAVLRESLVVALGGIAFGLFITKYARHYLLSISRDDDIYSATLFGSVALVLLVAAFAAALIPALRATRVDPTESLRSD